MIEWFKGWYHRYHYQKMLRQIRENFYFFGHDLSGWTDKEIEDSVCEVGMAIASSAVTVNEATAAMRDVAKLLQDFHERN